MYLGGSNEEELVLVIDFGGQYNQLIARRVRECNVYCEVHPYNISLEKIKEMNPKGIIFTGGPNSVYGEDSPLCDKAIFELEFLYLEYVMVLNLWLIYLEEKLLLHL